MTDSFCTAPQELRHKQGFKVKPFEWLYEQLQPLLLPNVLTRNWGIPLALSVVYTCVGLRLGVSLLPQKVRQSPAGKCWQHTKDSIVMHPWSNTQIWQNWQQNRSYLCLRLGSGGRLSGHSECLFNVKPVHFWWSARVWWVTAPS